VQLPSDHHKLRRKKRSYWAVDVLIKDGDGHPIWKGKSGPRLRKTGIRSNTGWKGAVERVDK